MIEVKIKNTFVRFSFTFFAAVALFLLTESGFGLAALCACGIHELSHLIMMIIFGVNADEILFYGAGIRISSREISSSGTIRQMLILFAGCAGNIAAAAVMLVVGNIVAAAINLIIALFNLLPFGVLDGAQLLKIAAVKFCKAENVDKLLRAVEILTLVAVILSVCYFSKYSIFVIVFILYFVVIFVTKN